MKATECVGKELEIQSILAKNALAKVKHDYIKLVEEAVKQSEAELEQIKMERVKKLGEKKSSLESMMKDMKKVTDEAAKLIKSGSKTELVSSHTTLSTKLQKLSQSQPQAADKTLGYVKFQPAATTIPTIGQVVKNGSPAQRWKLSEQFSTGDFKELYGLGCQ